MTAQAGDARVHRCGGCGGWIYGGASCRACATTPCSDTPWLWDDYLDGEDKASRNARLDSAKEQCLTCPAYQRCAELDAAALGLTGVVAGRYYDEHHRRSA